MADILLDNEALPSTPAASKSILFCDTGTKKLGQMDDGGNVNGALSSVYSASGVASQSISAATDTYVTSSGIQIPSFGMKVGQLYRWWIQILKNGTGTVAPVFTVRVGTAQSTGDAARVTITAAVASTAVAAGGIVLVACQVRTVSASGVLVGNMTLPSVQFGTGMSSTGVSSTFDNTALGSGPNYVGISINTGTSGPTYTVDAVRGELVL